MSDVMEAVKGVALFLVHHVEMGRVAAAWTTFIAYAILVEELVQIIARDSSRIRSGAEEFHGFISG